MEASVTALLCLSVLVLKEDGDPGAEPEVISFASLQALGMTKPPAAKQLFLRRMLRRVEARGEDALGVARVDRELGDPNWHLLRRLTALDPGGGLSRIVSRLSASTLSIPSAGAPRRGPDAGLIT